MKMYFFILVSLAAVTCANVTDIYGIQYKYCNTDACIYAASEILDSIDETVDPCDNFYMFACGRWIKNNPLNQSYAINILSKIKTKTKKQLQEILEEPIKKYDTQSLQKAKQIFAQCVDYENSVAAGKSNFKAIVNKYFEWPLIMTYSEWRDKNVTWQNVSTTLLENGFDNGLFEIAVFANTNMSNRSIIINIPTLLKSSEHMIELSQTPWQKEEYKSYILNISLDLAKTNFRAKTYARLYTEALDIINFEIKLALLTKDYENNKESNTFYNLTIEELQTVYDAQHPGRKGQIDWHLTLQKVFASEGITIKPSENLIVQTYNYLIDLIPLLQRTPVRTIVNYMQWNSIRKLYRHIRQSISKDSAFDTMRADKRENDKKLRCVESYNLKSAILHEYVKRYLSQESIQEIKNIIMDVEYVVYHHIKNCLWMDSVTEQASLEKLAAIKYELVKPDSDDINNYYENLNVNTAGYVETVINLFQFEKKKMLGSLRTKPVDNIRWDIEPTDVNPYYSFSYNKIVIPAALLQSPIYNRTYLDILNYATIGSFIGRQINNAFDTHGRRYNKSGNAWQLWSPRAVNKYDKVAKCFANQYNDLFPGLEHKTASENEYSTLENYIGDFAGLLAVYKAYKIRKMETGMIMYEWRLAGLEKYSEDQIFFLKFAQMFCDNIENKRLKEITSGIHSPNEVRVRGSLSNLIYFADAYECPEEMPMNPEKKCNFWE